MHRNLDRRVEVLLRVTDTVAQRQLQQTFDAALAPDVRSWQLAGDGSWARTGHRDYHREQIAHRGDPGA
jgi:polyphosphate kinase